MTEMLMSQTVLFQPSLALNKLLQGQTLMTSQMGLTKKPQQRLTEPTFNQIPRSSALWPIL